MINVGYDGTFRVINPSYMSLLSNLSAEVQFMSAHGNIDNIKFLKSGITVGGDISNSDIQFVGTNNIKTWENNTSLVSYISCYSAGNGELNDYSITYQTVVEGAEVALGFKDQIVNVSSESWTKRYNEKLADGYGVLDAANYANQFIYRFDSIKNCQIVYRNDPNIKISKFSTLSEKNIAENNILKAPINIVEDKNEIIMQEIKKDNPNFDINNYIVKDEKKLGITNINTNVSDEIIYKDFQFKIGDFVTESGYTIEIKNEKIEAIYDNTIPNEKELLKNEKEFDKEIFKDKEKYFVKNANEKVKEKYSFFEENINVEDNDPQVLYYYDIKNDKKYAIVNVKSEIVDGDKTSIAYDSIEYEL